MKLLLQAAGYVLGGVCVLAFILAMAFMLASIPGCDDGYGRKVAYEEWGADETTKSVRYTFTRTHQIQVGDDVVVHGHWCKVIRVAANRIEGEYSDIRWVQVQRCLPKKKGE